jgi:translation initiation factor 2A
MIHSQALFLCQSDVDNSGKSYYGETNLYLISLDGSHECKVQLGKHSVVDVRAPLCELTKHVPNLDKEGPIYDFAWNPNSREFGVVYGCEWTRRQIARPSFG